MNYPVRDAQGSSRPISKDRMRVFVSFSTFKKELF